MRTDGTAIANFTKHSAEAFEVVFSPDGKFVASTSLDRTVKLWQINGTEIATSIGHTAPVSDVDFASDRSYLNGDLTFISGGFDTTIRFWQLTKIGQEVKIIEKLNIPAHQAIITDIDISQDGQLIVSVSHDRYLKLWKPNGELIKSIFADNIGLRAVSISPDKQIIATGGKEQNVKLWNIDGELITTLEGHQAIVLDVEFSPDGSQIASASADKTIKIWSKKGKLLTTLRGHQGRVWNVDFSPDGSQIVSAAEDKQVKLWYLARILQLNPQKYGCAWIKDYLKTNAEVEDRDLCN